MLSFEKIIELTEKPQIKHKMDQKNEKPELYIRFHIIVAHPLLFFNKNHRLFLQ